jgi:hypothetical protein
MLIQNNSFQKEFSKDKSNSYSPWKSQINQKNKQVQ